MSENKDQKPAITLDEVNAPGASSVLSLEDLDKEIAADDPEFLAELSDIKLTAEGSNLSVMDEAFQVLAQSEITIWTRITELVNFKANPKRFLMFWPSVAGIGGLAFFTWGVQKNFLDQKLFMTSYAELGGEVRDYNPLTEFEAFYDNPKFSKNIMTLSKMFINLKMSENSGPTPMLVLELNVEGLSSDAIIEIKDREAEFKDMLLRTTEEKTYDDLVGPKGKIELCDQLRQVINAHLTRGQVRKVLLSSFIIKP